MKRAESTSLSQGLQYAVARRIASPDRWSIFYAVAAARAEGMAAIMAMSW